jgi:hypothetical protein
MKFSPAGRTMVLILSLATLPAFATRTHRASNAGHSRASLKHIISRHSLRHARKPAVIKGQRQIDPARATQIQEALIHENYLTGTPSGQWDADTETAMQKFQADHGWQTKLTPDSRALIKLGLGPNQDSQVGPAFQDAQKASATPTAPENDTLASAHAIRE